MKFILAAVLAIAFADDHEAAAAPTTSDKKEYTLAGTTVSSSAGMLKGTCHTENNNGTKNWVWNFSLHQKTGWANANTNQYQCVYMGVATTTEGKHQTAAVCSTSVSNGTSFTGTVETFEWTYKSNKFTYNQANSNTSTAAVGGSTAKLETSVWSSVADPTGAKDGSWVYQLSAMRPLENASAPLTAGSKVDVYPSYYIWSAATSSNLIRDFSNPADPVNVDVLDAAGATSLAAASLLAVAALNF